MTFFNIFSKKPVQAEENLKILIDNREKQSLVPSSLVSLGIEIEFQQLPVGDYLVNQVIVERKTLSDLQSSIINKRILSQIDKLKEYPQFLLIIEGLDTKEPIIHENALRGFLLSLTLKHKVPIIFSLDEKDTAKYLFLLAKKPKTGEISLRPGIKFKSKQHQLQYILEGFPFIGPKKSKKLLEKFKSIKNIINAGESELREILGKRTSDFLNLLD